MSQQQRPSFISFILFAVMIYLGMMLFFQGTHTAPLTMTEKMNRFRDAVKETLITGNVALAKIGEGEESKVIRESLAEIYNVVRAVPPTDEPMSELTRRLGGHKQEALAQINALLAKGNEIADEERERLLKELKVIESLPAEALAQPTETQLPTGDVASLRVEYDAKLAKLAEIVVLLDYSAKRAENTMEQQKWESAMKSISQVIAVRTTRETAESRFFNGFKLVADNARTLAQDLKKEGEENKQGASYQTGLLLEFEAARLQLSRSIAEKDFNATVMAGQALQGISDNNPESEIGIKAKELAQHAKTTAAQFARHHASGPSHLGYLIIDAMVKATGSVPGLSYWLVAVVLAIVARILVWPLAKKQMMSFKRMALLMPMIKELQKNYQGAELQQRTMNLYKRYGVNPMAGCFPMLIQIPFFLWIFWSMNLYRFEFQNGTFLWINPSTAQLMPGFLAPNLGERDFPLIIIYGISMIITSLISVTDPQQAKQARIIGVVLALVFTIAMFFWILPSAFVLYWIAMNIVTTIQTLSFSKKPIPPLVEVQGGGNGAFGSLPPSDKAKDITAHQKTGAPVLHKPKSGKKGGKKRK